jgi:site-specific DNA-cytosine methylase
VALEQVGRKMSGGPEVGKGWKNDGTMYALDRKGAHGVMVPRQAYTKKHGANHSEDYETWGEAEVARCLAGGELAHTSGATGAAVTEEDATVRKLTPTECERLQGFPDGWTALE